MGRGEGVYISLQGRIFTLIHSLLLPILVVGFTCLSHYAERVAILLLLAWLSSPLIGFCYIKPSGRGATLPIKHSIFSTLLKAGGVQPSL